MSRSRVILETVQWPGLFIFLAAVALKIANPAAITSREVGITLFVVSLCLFIKMSNHAMVQVFQILMIISLLGCYFVTRWEMWGFVLICIAYLVVIEQIQ